MLNCFQWLQMQPTNKPQELAKDWFTIHQAPQGIVNQEWLEANRPCAMLMLDGKMTTALVQGVDINGMMTLTPIDAVQDTPVTAAFDDSVLWIFPDTNPTSALLAY